MKIIPKRALQAFRHWGREGGIKRAGRLSAETRQMISRRAAQMRWNKEEGHQPSLFSVRLEEPHWGDPVYLEEVLSYGGVNEWRRLRRIIADRPFGLAAIAVEKVLSATPIYGVTPLWKRILQGLRGNFS